MSNYKNFKSSPDKYCADFETTSYKGITETEVWSSCWCELKENSEIHIATNIDDFMLALVNDHKEKIVYFHNLKFDGSFIVNWLYEHGFNLRIKTKVKDLNEKEFTTLISDMGQWYTIDLISEGIHIQFRDSLKLLPFSLKKLAEDFKLTTQKGEIEYTAHKHANEYITTEEERYIRDDVIILRDSLLKMFSEGHCNLTIGSCCLSEFKRDPYIINIGFNNIFPNHEDISIGTQTADKYIRQSYHGAFCYVNPKIEGKTINHLGSTYDVNSLYPYVMEHYSYPTGKPFVIEDKTRFTSEFNQTTQYFFIEFTCRFKLKKGYLPTVQIKDSAIYKPNEWLTTSDYYDKKSQTHSRWYIKDGELSDTQCHFVMTETDYMLFHRHYRIFDEKIIRQVRYNREPNIFNNYIEKYRKIKENSVGAIRTIAKLFSNNLYGKMATSTNSSFKKPYITSGGLKFDTIIENEKNAGYIPIGSAITSYARCFIIEKAQSNYNSFCYCDTDSLHLITSEPKDIELHDTRYGCFKRENTWKKARFIRQKTYVELNTDDSLLIKACGCTDKCKNKIEHLIKEHGMGVFKKGLSVDGKLIGKQIKGGMILEEQTFTVK